MTTPEDVLGPEGLLSKALPGFNYRAQQVEMASEIDRAIRKNSILIAEAGTGTGKTFAYLIPALLSGQKVLVSTGTKTLQDQLFHRDLPVITKALGIPVRVSLLKGRNNYLCRYRLEKNLVDGRFKTKETAQHFQQVNTWARHTEKGDIAEIKDIPENAPVWPSVTSTTDNCLGSDCPDSEKCFVNQARTEAHMADLVVCNHHLFFADLALQAEGINDLLPKTQALIFDEAHQLPDIASQFLGTSVTTGQIKDLLKDATQAVEDEAHDATEGFRKQHQELTEKNDAVFMAFNKLPDRDTWYSFQRDDKATTAISRWRESIARFCGMLEDLSKRGTELNNCFQRGESLLARLDSLTTLEPGFVHWYQQHKSTLSFHASPLEIDSIMQERMQQDSQAWIFTSATLSVNASFDFFMKRLGISEAITRQWDSDFNYKHNCLLYSPDRLPEPNSPGYTRAVVNAALPVLRLTHGRAFFLFTSHRALQESAELLKDTEFELFIQGSTSKMKLLDDFKSSTNGILLGTSSFWEGVDVKGEALSCVIIDKLPFASPGDPILAARVAHMREQGIDPFHNYQLPQAVITLKQGVGRLIRDENDFGILMICDPRLLSKPYGKIFLRSLPAVYIRREVDNVERFLKWHEDELQNTVN